MPPPSPSTIQPSSSAAAIQGPHGETKIFFQAPNGAIREWSGIGALAAGAKYAGRIIVAPGVARKNSPLAVTTWGDTNKNGNFNEVSMRLASFPFSFLFRWSHTRFFFFVGILDEMSLTAAPRYASISSRPIITSASSSRVISTISGVRVF
jgi:hypothetical protein